MRARNIKPGFFVNENLISMPPFPRLLFLGLWCMADREGRLEDRPTRIKYAVFPGDDIDVDNCLNTLADGGFIIRYEAAGGQYIQVINFKKHQTPHVKEKISTIPAPDLHSTSTRLAPPDSLIPDSLIPDSLIPEGGKPAVVDNELLDELLDMAAGIVSKKSAWSPTKSDRISLNALCEQFPPTQLRRELQKFKAYAAQRDWSLFGRAFVSWMGRVTPEPMTVRRPDAREVRIQRTVAHIRATGDEDTARSMCFPDEWAEAQRRMT